MKEVFAVIVIILLVSLAISYWYIWLPILAVVVGIYIYSSSGKKNAVSAANNSIKSKSQKAELESGKVEVSRQGSRHGPLFDAVNNDIRIMNESLDLINNSKNIQTVVKRYRDLIAALERLSSYEGNPAISFQKELPSAALVRIEAEKTQILNCAIQRAYDDVLHKCAALKTEKGRKNRQTKFFDELDALMEHFTPETREFAIDFINQNIDDPLTDLNGL